MSLNESERLQFEPYSVLSLLQHTVFGLIFYASDVIMNINFFQTASDRSAELKQVFAIFDKNGDGYISK